jgi:monomeric sarcosine oxidase
VDTFDVAVIGVGVMGAAAGRALARSGKKVVLLERFEIGHNRGSSHGAGRIFRYSYHDPRYVAMAQESMPLWRDLEKEVGSRLLTTTGGIDVGDIVPEHAAALEECGASFELLEGAEVNRRFPGVTLPNSEQALFQADTSVVAAERAWRAMATSAAIAGAELRENTRVTEILPQSGGAEVEAEGGRLRAETVLVTAGPWARDLLASIDIPLDVSPTRETIAYFRTRREQVPVVVAWSNPAFYALPVSGMGIKAGEHIAGPPSHPDLEGGPDQASLQRLGEGVAQRFADVERQPHLIETCFYTNTSDAHFVLERHGPVVVGSPCSGHGFKFSPLIGARLAELCGS